MKTDVSVVKLPRTLIESVKQRRRPGQAIRGVIEELLAGTNTGITPDTLARLERYRVSDKDSIDDLIKYALNENLEFEKKAGAK